ncbi:MAG: cation:proton antiporter [Alphaproteobacteria bacterium]|nr:MAG: cation:proton antiporter [Alphaproteobacteria bacterium]
MSPLEPLTLLAIFSLCYALCWGLTARVRGLGVSVTIVELTIGFILGNWFLPLEAAKAIGGISEIGALALFFLVGLHADLREIKMFRRDILSVTGIGAAAALSAVLAIYDPLGLTRPEALFAAATVMATGVGVVMRVLQEYGHATTRTGRLLLACSAVEDFPAILLLCAAPLIASDAGLTLRAGGALLVKTGLAISCVVAARYFLASKKIPPIPAALLLPAIIIAAWGTSALGFTSLLGAFLIGVLCGKDKEQGYEAYLKPVMDFFIPIFFIMVGMRIKAETLLAPQSWMLASVLISVAFASKLLCFSGIQERTRAAGIDPWTVTLGMLPRGLPGLVFATVALNSGLIRDVVFSALVIMVTVTNTVGLTLLSSRLRGQPDSGRKASAVPDGE